MSFSAKVFLSIDLSVKVMQTKDLGWRFSNRGGQELDQRIPDADRFVLAVSQASGKRLAYAQLTGKEVDSLHHSAAERRIEEEPF